MTNPLTRALMEMSEEQVASLYKTTFSSPDAQLCLQDIKNRAYREAPIATDKETGFLINSDNLYFRAGMQSLCFSIESQIDYQPPTKEEFTND